MNPLFRDVGVDDQRKSEWAGPHGFLLAAWGRDDLRRISRQYLQAAESLIESIEQQHVADFEIAYPVLYLYRHAIELILKCLVGPSNEHRLDVLGVRLVTFARDAHNQSVPAWITHTLSELARIDPTSQAFRHGEDCYSRPKATRESVPDETYVRVSELRLEMTRLYKALDSAVDVSGGNKARPAS